MRTRNGSDKEEVHQEFVDAINKQAGYKRIGRDKDTKNTKEVTLELTTSRDNKLMADSEKKEESSATVPKMTTMETELRDTLKEVLNVYLQGIREGLANLKESVSNIDTHTKKIEEIIETRGKSEQARRFN